MLKLKYQVWKAIRLDDFFFNFASFAAWKYESTIPIVCYLREEKPWDAW